MILPALITGLLCALSFLLGWRYGWRRCNRLIVPIMLETSDKWAEVCRETNAQWEALHRNLAESFAEYIRTGQLVLPKRREGKRDAN